MIISRLPSFLQRFFRPFTTALSDDQFRHLWGFVLGLVVNLRAAKLLHLSNVAPDAAGHRTRHGAFCARGGCRDAPGLLHDAALELLGGMKPQAGEVVYLILDDNRTPNAAARWTTSARCGTTSSSGSSADTSCSPARSASAA